MFWFTNFGYLPIFFPILIERGIPMAPKKEVNLLKIILIGVVALVVIGVAIGVLLSGGPKAQPGTEPVQTEQSQTEPAQTQPPQGKPALQKTGPTIYAMVPEDWDSVCIWAWKYEGKDAFEEWPGEAMTKGADGWYSATIPTWADCVIINGNNGTVQTYDLYIGANLDAWIHVLTPEYANVYYKKPSAAELQPDPFLEAALKEDFETMKRLLPTIKDRSILKEWEYNDFNYAYATDCVRAGDYETAIEFFDYCAFDGHKIHATIFRQLLDGDIDGAIETKMAYGFTTLESDLDMKWSDIICQVRGITKDENDLNYLLLDEYLTRRMWINQPSFTEKSLVFGEPSNWEAEGYVSELKASEYYFPVSNLNTLYSQCGSEANGKVLILRAQKSYPAGTMHYAVDLLTMDYLSYDLYPASLSEVEYVIIANYDYVNEGQYRQTFSSNSNSVVSYFFFLRMTGRVQLINARTQAVIQQSSKITGTGEVQAHFSDDAFQCSNMPETGADIIKLVEKVRELNGSK